MKKMIYLIIKFLINTAIIIFILSLCFIGFTIFISKTNNIELEDTISYIKSFGDTTVLANTNSINISLATTSNSFTSSSYPITTNNKFYYNQLDNNAKIIYDSLENNINNLKKDNYTIDFSTTFNDLLNKSNGESLLNSSFQSALDAFCYDHPEIFYIDLTKISMVIKYTSIGPITKYTVSIKPQNGTNYLYDYYISENEVNEAILKAEKIKDNLINNLSDTNDYDKALEIHDALVNSLKYSDTLTSKNIRNIYGALVEKDVVCEGYAKAFKYILDSVGIECILVSGTATNSSNETENHMWNYINLDDNWYGVDVTWDDPIIVGSSFSSNIIRHDYFCKGSNVFNTSHIVDNKISDNGSSFTLPTLSYENYK